jgi:hypothetical protein
VSDFDADGRVDLAVAQTGNRPKLFHNRRARPGLRVRLAGSEGNPTGVGAVMRLGFGDKLGPAREIQAGSGYWSQSSATIVMATPDSPSTVLVRWPGGKTTTSPVPAGAREIQLRFNGDVQVLR